MPGALVVADWQVELRDVLTGNGTPYQLGPKVIQGLDVPEAKTHDTDLGHAAGSYQGRDYTGPRTVLIDYAIDGNSDAAAAGTTFRTLSALWVASTVDLPLYMQVPGFGKIRVNGRPRGLVADLADLSIGFVTALAVFECGDPTIQSVFLPSAPTIGTATAGVGSATINWTPPANWGGNVGSQDVLLYRASDNAALYVEAVGASATTHTFTGLAAGVGVYGKVFGVNSAGTGPGSAASNIVTPT